MRHLVLAALVAATPLLARAATYTSYPAAGALDGSEIIGPVRQRGADVTVRLGALLFGLPAPSGQFYADKGAAVGRDADRALFGAAADNQAISNRAATPTDWLSTIMGGTSVGAWPVYGAQTASLARFGNIGLLGASRSSDARVNAGLLGYQPASIGVAGWGINDDTVSPTSTNAWAFYGEAWRMPNVSYEPTFGMELESVNLGGAAGGSSTPYQVNVGGGVYGLQLGAGGGQTSGTSDAQAGITFVPNPSRFQTGIIFGAKSLTGTDGTAADTGYARAIALGRNQAIEWIGPDGQSGGFVRSTVSATANATRVEMQDGGLVVSNSGGLPLFTVKTTATPTNTLSIQAGTGTQAAGLYATGGAGGNGNVGLYPASGGEIQTNSATTAQGATLPTTPAAWLHLNVNGTDYRVPLFTPAQAGG